MSDKIAVVTGGNKGIGFGIVKGLCERFTGKVYLTSRDVTRGQEAVKKLNDLGRQPIFYQLDVTNQESIDKFKNHIIKEHGGIDILINNAGIGFADDAPEPFSQQAEDTIYVNYTGLVKITTSLLPILRNDARIVNISSSLGHLHWIPSNEIKIKFSDPSLTLPKLNSLMEEFVRDVKAGIHESKGWGNTIDCTYIVAKVGCTAFTMIQQRELNIEKPFRNISVNAVHPGYVATDLTAHLGHLSIEQGAEVPLYLALDEHGLKGKYVWCDKTTIDWDKGIPPSRD